MNLLEWHNPWWLLLALTPVVLYSLDRLLRGRRLRHYASEHLLPWLITGQRQGWRRRLWSRSMSWFLVWPLLALAAAGPRLPDPLQQDGIRETVDIAVVLDTSRSMRVQDQAPDRFRRARIELHELIERLNGDRLALIPFAGSAHLLVPPTWDMQVIRHYLDRLKPDLLPIHGSQADQAIALARTTLTDTRHNRSRAVLLLTDGDFDTATRQAVIAEAKRLKQSGIPLFILGLGNRAGGGILLDNGQWLSRHGQPVISRLESGFLKELAEQTGGRFIRSSRDDSDWRALYDEGMARLASYRISKAQRNQVRWRELYPWFLVPALIILSLLLFPSVRHLRASSILLLLVASFQQPDVLASDLATIERQAWQAWKKGDHARAAALYRQLPGYRGSFGLGVSLYRRRDYAAAARQFARAVIDAGNDNERAAALFNLGNSWFQLGRYQAAAESYHDSLRYRPNHLAATRNLSFTQALLKEIRRQQRMARLLRRSSGGRGPRPGSGEGGMGSYGSEGRDINRKRLAARYRVPPDKLARLIARGLRFAQVVGKRHSTGNVTDPHDLPGLVSIRARMRQLDDRVSLLIKTLLEMEAGYPAPLDQQETRPGIRPW